MASVVMDTSHVPRVIGATDALERGVADYSPARTEEYRSVGGVGIVPRLNLTHAGRTVVFSATLRTVGTGGSNRRIIRSFGRSYAGRRRGLFGGRRVSDRFCY